MRTPIETTAVMDLTPSDLNDLVKALRAYHALYSPLFQRREQREWAAKYLHGLLLPTFESHMRKPMIFDA